jgi:hypothetical protein
MNTHALKMKLLQALMQHARAILVASHLWQAFVSIRTDVYELEIISIYTYIIRVDRRSTAVLRCSFGTMPQVMATVEIF